MSANVYSYIPLFLRGLTYDGEKGAVIVTITDSSQFLTRSDASELQSSCKCSCSERLTTNQLALRRNYAP